MTNKLHQSEVMSSWAKKKKEKNQNALRLFINNI